MKNERVVIYTRTSTTRSYNESCKERQVISCNNFISSNKLVLAKSFSDLGVSNCERAAFNRIIRVLS